MCVCFERDKLRLANIVYLRTQDAKRLLETFSESAHSLYTFVKL